jgi:hypothetical protein
MRFQFSWSIQDGKLDHETGRIVIYQGYVVRSNGPSRDHNDLLKSLAARYRVNRDDVYARANRFYWKPGNGGIFISPVRKVDEDWAYANAKLFKHLIDKEFENARY